MRSKHSKRSNGSRFDDTLICNSPKPPSGVSRLLAQAVPTKTKGKGVSRGSGGRDGLPRHQSPLFAAL